MCDVCNGSVNYLKININNLVYNLQKQTKINENNYVKTLQSKKKIKK